MRSPVSQRCTILYCVVLCVASTSYINRCYGLEIIGNFLAPGEVFPGPTGEMVTGPPQALVGGGNLTDIFEAAASVWEAAILDDYTLTINYGWADRLDFFGFEIRVAQQSEAPYRITESSIWIGSLADESFPFYMDPTPLDPSEYARFDVSHRDSGAGDMNTERVFRGATGLAENSADLFTVLLHEIGHALGLDVGITAYINDTKDGYIDVGEPLPLAGSKIESGPFFVSRGLRAGRTHVCPSSALMARCAAGLRLGQRAYPTELDILAVAQLSQFTDVNLQPAQFPEPYRGPGSFIDVIGDREVYSHDVRSSDFSFQEGEVLFGPDGQIYLFPFQDSGRDIFRYDSETLELTDVFASEGNTVWEDVSGAGTHAAAFGPDGNIYIVGKDGQTSGVLRYSGTTGDFMDILDLGGGGGWPLALTFGPEGDLYVLENLRTRNAIEVVQYDTETGRKKGAASERIISTDFWLADLLFGPDGDLFIRTDIVRGGETRPVLRRSNGELFIENLDEGVLRRSKADPPRTTGPIAFGPDGNLYAMMTSWENGNSVRVFDGSTGDYLGEFIDGATGGLNYGHLSFGPDGNLYVSSSDGVLIFKGPVVPEPSGLAMISLGMFGVTVLRRRRLNRTIHE